MNCVLCLIELLGSSSDPFVNRVRFKRRELVLMFAERFDRVSIFTSMSESESSREPSGLYRNSANEIGLLTPPGNIFLNRCVTLSCFTHRGPTDRAHSPN
jgi:hypothetical protein